MLSAFLQTTGKGKTPSHFSLNKYHLKLASLSNNQAGFFATVISCFVSTVCPTRYRTRHFFNNFTTNEDIAINFEADLPHCVRNVTTSYVLLFTFRCNIFISVRIIKEMPGSVASGILCISLYLTNTVRQLLDVSMETHT